MKINLPIIRLKVSQSVDFNNQANTFFAPPTSVEVRNMKTAYTLTEQEDGSVMLESATQLVRIGKANIAYIWYDKSAQVEEVAPVVAKKSKA